MFGEVLIIGQGSNLEGIEKFKQELLDQLGSVKGTLPEKSDPVPFGKYTKETRRLMEKTSSGPYIVTPVMVKTQATGMETSEILWMASNFTWFSGYYPALFREGLYLIIHKNLIKTVYSGYSLFYYLK